MRMNRKYLVAVVLLAVLAVVFGFAGMAEPVSKSGSPQQESSSSADSVTHFMNPPTFDSDWVDITDERGQYFNVTHDLNTTEVFVDIVGKRSLSGTDGEHQRNLGVTGYTQGWSKTYGGANSDSAFSVVQTSDGGYALAGRFWDAATNPDFWLIKINPVGDTLWSKTYGETGTDEAYSVVQTGDGGYALAGYTTSYGAGSEDFWLVKTDSAGNVLWNKTYGEASPDVAYSMVHTNDGGYALAGRTYDAATSYDFWLVKTESDGNMQWNKTYEVVYTDEAHSVVQTNDGGYALAGYTNSFDAGNYDFWLVKTDSAGNMQWNKTYGRVITPDEAYSVVQTADGGYVLAGSTYVGAGNTDFWLVKTDSDGNMLWNKTYGGASWECAYSVVHTNDGAYMFAGYTNSYGAGGDFWLVKTDSDGNMLWNKTYGGTGGEVARSIVQTSDGGYAIAGYTSSYGAGSSDFWLVKTDTETGLTWTDSTDNTITLYRGATDPYWNYVRVRTWIIKEPTWQFGDINQDGVVDVQDLYILSQNYGKTFSLLSLSGIIAVAGVHTYKKRKQPK